MKKKQLMTLLLTAAMTVSCFAGCGCGSASSSSSQSEKPAAAADSETDKTESEAEGGEEAALSKAEQAIADRKAGGELPTVVMATLTWTGRPTGTDRVQKALNAYFEETLGVHIDLEIMDFSSYSQELTLMLSGGEQVDIFNAISMGYPNAISRGYALELDELLADYGQGICETIDNTYLEAARVDGSIYGLPQMKETASGKGRFVVPTRYLDELGFDWQSRLSEDGENIESTLEEVDQLFDQLHELYPDKIVLYPNKGTGLANSILFDAVGNDNFGVLMDFENSLEITNLFETDEFRTTCEWFRKWNEEGYIYKEVLTDTTSPQVFMQSDRAMVTLANWKPGGKLEQEAQILENIVYFKVLGEFVSSGAVTSMAWCINQASEDPVAAMQVLNAFYSDPVASTLLARGEEGVDYVIADDGFLDYPEGVDSNTKEYYSLEWLNPNQTITGVWRGNPADVYERTKNFNQGAMVSKALGFAFDNSAVASEYTALANAYNEYIYQVLYGFVDTETGIKEMNDKLYAAGLEKYMAAKQEALNAWAAEKGVQ